VLLHHADTILDQFVTAQAELEALARGSTGTLRLGAYQSVAARLLPTVLRLFLAERGGANVRLSEGITDFELLMDLERGELDLTYADAPLPTGPFISELVLKDPFVLVVDGDSDLGRSDRLIHLDFSDRDPLPLICFESLRCTERALLHLIELGANPEIIVRSDHITTVQGLVAAGVGVALIPRMSYDSLCPSTRCIDLGPHAPTREICLVRSADRELSPIARAYLDLSVRIGPRVVEAERERMSSWPTHAP
jgi:DNA-binding transcriptional LysR family regulator